MTEQEFQELYTQEYNEYIQSFFKHILTVQKEYPNFLYNQIAYYESLIINNANQIVAITIFKNKVNLQLLFNKNYSDEYLLNKLVKKCWLIQKTIRDSVFEPFKVSVLQKMEDD